MYRIMLKQPEWGDFFVSTTVYDPERGCLAEARVTSREVAEREARGYPDQMCAHVEEVQESDPGQLGYWLPAE